MKDKEREKILLREMKSLLDVADAEARDLTASELSRYKELEQELDAEKPYKPDFKSSKASWTTSRPTSLFGVQVPTWQNIFNRAPAENKDFSSLGDLLIKFHAGHGSLDQLRNVNQEGVGVDGGFAVPEQMWSEIYSSGIEASVCLDLVTQYPMKTNVLNIPALDSEDHSDGPTAAVRGEWLGETQQATRVVPKLRTLAYVAKKLAMYISASSEVLQDSVSLGKTFAKLMRDNLAFLLDEAILTGSGVGRPLGILSSPAVINYTRATANTIDFTDMTGMAGRLLPASLNTAVWICSPRAFGVLLAMETAATTGNLVLGYRLGGASQYNMQALNIPVRVTEKLPDLGTKGDLILADLSFYGLGIRETARFERTNAAQWLSDLIDTRFIIRADGKPLVDSAITPANGGETLSPFVALD